MFTANLSIFFALAVALAILSFITLFLATRHDKVVSLAGPIEEERAVLARIEEKRRTLNDLEEDLQKRREALAHMAKVQAEVDALINKLAELQTEWNQTEARRAEVQALRMEIESIQTEKLAVAAELASARADLAEVRDRLEKAETLVHRIDALTAQSQQLEARVAELQASRQELEAAKERVASLRDMEDRLRTQIAENEGLLAARRSELIETEERIVSARSSLIGTRQELDQTGAELAAARQKAVDLEADRTAALVQLNAIEREAQRLEGANADLEMRLTSARTDLAGIEAQLEAARRQQADLHDERERLAAELAIGQQKVADLEREQASAQEHLDRLGARKATLEYEIDKARGIAAGGVGAVADDPLRELKEPPQVVAQLSAWPQSSIIAETEALKRVRQRFETFGLDYPDRTLRAFHTAMKVNDTTQMTVLAGISGTGKSQLPRQYAAGMGIGFLQVPVQPRWDSPQDLMGFYNYIEGRFRPTDMARAMFALDAQNNPDAVQNRLLMVLLDEMNLARVEYYFSDFLSRLESRPARGKEENENLRKDAEIELEIPKAEKPTRIFPGYNLLFAGTMNEDESTQSLSDKVVDRANVMRFGAPKQIAKAKGTDSRMPEEALSREIWEKWCKRGLQPADQIRAEGRVNEMLALMRDFGKPFGHRLGRAILAYAGAYPEAEGIGDRVNMALADQIEMRLLPKLRGVDVEEKSQQFEELRRKAAEFGDDALAEAIANSVEAAVGGTGQFIWKGVVR
ncbi:chromosome segregation ATPase-like protein [Cereibacter sediminicola]|uniref:chromosome segregation ATPase-like protein n=1 Tax=Cereibacter sediminicola TaxID=2584941 RepID=UPI0011AB2C15|nr:chromosome segregation ATPase-like protein [Cereibacter sediminicola]